MFTYSNKVNSLEHPRFTYTHRRKDNGEVIVIVDRSFAVFDQTGLTTDLGGDLIERRTPRQLAREKEMGLTSLCGRPAAEKIGIFCPRAMLFITSIAEMPV